MKRKNIEVKASWFKLSTSLLKEILGQRSLMENPSLVGFQFKTNCSFSFLGKGRIEKRQFIFFIFTHRMKIKLYSRESGSSTVF